VDFTNAFVQADLKDPIYVQFPQGFESSDGYQASDYCLKLLKSCYGTRIAPKLFYEHLRDRLAELGFQQSRFDPCLFYRKGTMIACYVDDVICVGRTDAELKKIIDDLKSKFKEMGIQMKQRVKPDARSYSTVFEDNAGCLTLAMSPHLTPRSRHYATKYHHFRKHVKQGTIKVVRVETKMQRADIFTKPLPQPAFEHLRKLLMGW
jgi:hypothetical protein